MPFFPLGYKVEYCKKFIEIYLQSELVRKFLPWKIPNRMQNVRNGNIFIWKSCHTVHQELCSKSPSLEAGGGGERGLLHDQNIIRTVVDFLS